MTSCDRQVKTVRRAVGHVVRAGGREVAEQQGLLGRAVEGVRLAQGVRVDAQPLDVLLVLPCPARLVAAPPARRPQGQPAEGLLEVRMVVMATA